MADLNWCTYCDNAIHPYSNSLYCSEECLRADALNNHPLLGYDYAELKDFPRCSTAVASPALTAASACSSLHESNAHSHPSPSLSPICLTSAHFFKEPPIFHLNGSSAQLSEEAVFQNIYTQPKSNHEATQPIFLHAWNHIPRQTAATAGTTTTTTTAAAKTTHQNCDF